VLLDLGFFADQKVAQHRAPPRMDADNLIEADRPRDGLLQNQMLQAERRFAAFFR
jgi:hypothetical protein